MCVLLRGGRHSAAVHSLLAVLPPLAASLPHALVEHTDASIRHTRPRSSACPSLASLRLTPPPPPLALTPRLTLNPTRKDATHAMSYGYPHQGYGGNPHGQGQYPPANLYSHDPYAPAPSPGANDYASEPSYPYPSGGADYSQSDFISPDRDGDGIPGGRYAQQGQTYPPALASDADLDKYGAAAAWEKPVPVTRGSIAAQVRAHPHD